MPHLLLYPTVMAICRLPPTVDVPNWVDVRNIHSITRTSTELSIVCAQQCVPEDVHAQRGWRMFAFEGTLEFSLTGVLLSVAQPLADAHISIFALSTFDTDYILVPAAEIDVSCAALHAAGFVISYVAG